MTYTGAMILPQNAALMQEDEMRYLEGGREIYVNKSHLNKSTCTKLGKKYSKEVGLSTSRIAKEIYAHAKLYYASSVASIVTPILPFLPGITKAVAVAGCTWIRSHANPINIGGDNAIRVAIYNAIWARF